MKNFYFLFVLIAISLFSFSSLGKSFAENSIGIFSIDSEISPTDSILVTGYVDTDFYSNPVNLEVYDPKGNLLYSPQVSFDNRGYFSWLFYPPEGQFDVIGKYTIIATHVGLEKNAKLYFTVVQENPPPIKDNITRQIEEVEGLNIFIVLSVAAIVVGVVIWMRVTYDDASISKKSLN